MTIRKAIQWLEMYANRPVKWDDYSDGSKAIREEAERQIAEAFKMAISALKAQEPVTPYRDLFLNWHCGYCKTEIDRYEGHKYCPECGRAVKWG